MRTQRFVIIALALASVAALVPGTAEAGSPGSVYVPLTPCRIYDSRVAFGGPGPFTANSTRNINIVGVTGPFPGGPLTGCGVPGYTGPLPGATAVAINITAASPAANGNFKVWQTSHTEPTFASIINFRTGANIANAAVIALDDDVVEGDDLEFRASQGSELIIDVLGYFVELGP